MVASGSTNRLMITLRSLVREARHAPDRLLHSRRRSIAVSQLRQLPELRTVLFVCHGNICRSPFAAATFARVVDERSPQRLTVRSAGFIGPGRPAPPEAQTAAKERGFDLRAHRSMVIDGHTIHTADLIVVMSADQGALLRRTFGRFRALVVVLGDLDRRTVRRREIRDPWGSDAVVFGEVYDRIQRCVAELVRAVSAPEAASPTTREPS